MNEPMSGWRTFMSGEPPGPAPGDEPGDPPRDGPSPRLRVLGVILAVAGGCAATATLVLVILLLSAPDPNVVLADNVGDPLGPDDAGTWATGTNVGAAPAGMADEGPGDVLVIDVAGAVVRPGLVRIGRGARVGDAIAAAGGFAPRVDLAETGRSLNLAASLEDGGKVVVPELGASQPETGPGAPGDARIDLNTADQATLEGLPGVGPVTALRIIEARQRQPFSSVDELRAREIVGESVFEDIRELVSASG